MKKQTILIVEDDLKNLKLTRTVLEIGDYQVLEAETAEHGIELAREYPPDLILMDIQLPKMDGLTATRLIKQDSELKAIPVVALTSHAMQGDQQEAVSAGCDGYISKPIDTKIFLTQIAGYLKTEDRSKSQAEEPPIIKPKILIVDDDRDNVKLIKAKLSGQAYVIDTAYDGIQALTQLEQEPPDLILLDIMMPGIDGFEVTRRIKADPATAEIPIILLTALDGAEDKARGMQVGADEYLTKPVKTVELRARVSSLLKLSNYKSRLQIRVESERQLYYNNRNRAEPLKRPHGQNVLIVEDDPKDINLLAEYLKAQPYGIQAVKNASDALKFLLNEKVDLVLLDIMLPDIDGFKLCQQIKASDDTRDVQVIFITGLDGLESKIKGIEQGADDYLVKPINRLELLARIEVLLKKKAYLDQLHNHCKLAMKTGINDGLTGLYSRSYFQLNLGLELKRTAHHGHMTALILVDFEQVSQIGTDCEYPLQDFLLRELACLVKSSVREIDVVARYAQYMFAVTLPYIDPELAKRIAEKIRARIRGYQLPDRALIEMEMIEPNLAVAVAPIDAVEADELIQRAIEMLSQVQCGSTNRFVTSYDRKDSQPSRTRH